MFPNHLNDIDQHLTTLSDLLSGNKLHELWREVASAGQLAELTVIENAIAVPALKERRRAHTRATFYSTGGVVLAQTQPCRVELSNTMKQSITSTLACTGRKG